MKGNLSTLALLLASALLLQAQNAGTPGLSPREVGASSLTGEDLIALCKDVDANPSSKGAAACTFYVSGFTDGYAVAMMTFNHGMQSGFCDPLEATNQQKAKVIVKYSADHPNQLWTKAAVFTAIALKDAYPCKK